MSDIVFFGRSFNVKEMFCNVIVQNKHYNFIPTKYDITLYTREILG